MIKHLSAFISIVLNIIMIGFALDDPFSSKHAILYIMSYLNFESWDIVNCVSCSVSLLIISYAAVHYFILFIV